MGRSGQDAWNSVRAMAGFVDVPLTVAAASVLRRWLETVPSEVVPVTHPADRQALADLLTALEMCGPDPSDGELEAARTSLLRNSGEWVHRGIDYRVG